MGDIYNDIFNEEDKNELYDEIFQEEWYIDDSEEEIDGPDNTDHVKVNRGKHKNITGDDYVDTALKAGTSFIYGMRGTGRSGAAGTSVGYIYEDKDLTIERFFDSNGGYDEIKKEIIERKNKVDDIVSYIKYKKLNKEEIEELIKTLNNG